MKNPLVRVSLQLAVVLGNAYQASLCLPWVPSLKVNLLYIGIHGSKVGNGPGVREIVCGQTKLQKCKRKRLFIKGWMTWSKFFSSCLNSIDCVSDIEVIFGAVSRDKVSLRCSGLEADYQTNSVIDQHLIRYIHGWVVPRTSEPFINALNKVHCYALQHYYEAKGALLLFLMSEMIYPCHWSTSWSYSGQLFTTPVWLTIAQQLTVLIPVGRVLYFDPSCGLCLCGSPRLGVIRSKGCCQLNPAVCYRHCSSSPNQQSLEHTARNQDSDVDILLPCKWLQGVLT